MKNVDSQLNSHHLLDHPINLVQNNQLFDHFFQHHQKYSPQFPILQSNIQSFRQQSYFLL